MNESAELQEHVRYEKEKMNFSESLNIPLAVGNMEHSSPMKRVRLGWLQQHSVNK